MLKALIDKTFLASMEEEQEEEEVTLSKQGTYIPVKLRTQLCPVCKTPMGDMPGSRDAYCPNCGFKDPCCE